MSASPRRHVFGAACVIIQPLLLNVVSVPITAYVIRTLGEAAYGQWATSAALAATAGLLTNLGLSMLLVRAVAQDPASAPREFADHLGLRLVLSLLAAALATLACGALGYPPVVLQCTMLAAVGLVFLGVGRVSADLLQALQRLPMLATTNLISGMVINIAALVLVVLKTGPVGLAFAYLLGAFTTAVLPLWVIRSHFPIRAAFRLERFKQLLRRTRALGAQIAFGSIAENGEALLVPKLVSIAQYGFFSAGVLIPIRLAVVPDGLTTAYYPIISAAYRRCPEAAAREVSRFLIASLALSLPLVVLVTFLAGPVSEILFPGRAGVCSMVMRITIWYVALAGVAQVMGYGLIAAGKEDLEARLCMVSTLAGLFLTGFMVAKFGLMGACYSFVGRHVLGLLVRVSAFVQTYATVPRRVPLARITTCGALMGGTMWLLAVLVDPHLMSVAAMGGRWVGPLFVIAVKAGLGVAAYGAALIAFRVFGLDELQRLLRKPAALAPE